MRISFPGALVGGGVTMPSRVEAAVRRRPGPFRWKANRPLGSRPPQAANDPVGAAAGFPELDCVRSFLTAERLEAAAQRAARIGVGADRVLISSGAIDEETYSRSLANWLGVAFESLDGVTRADCPLNDERLLEAAATGLLPLAVATDRFSNSESEIQIVMAPRGIAVPRLIRMIGERPALAQRFRFTTAERFNRFVLRYGGKALAIQANDGLTASHPLLSAAPLRKRFGFAPVAAGLPLAAAIAIVPNAATIACEILLAVFFTAWTALRIWGACVGAAATAAAAMRPIADDRLPVYTVIAALYKEAASVDALLAAIERLDYPIEKLDVILAVEADDHETRAAIAKRRSRFPISVIPAPAAGPRTKPKALNAALHFARGTFTVVYDAEDRPEPEQLRCALQAFKSGGETLACVQARLCIDNTADGWLTRMFTAEYAGHFDVFLLGLAALQLPLPLGGSSNHFRTDILRKTGAWDPYNVTEDADLGIRLARFGYGTRVIDTTTYEEAPGRLGPWLRQRTRWFKGWIRTWLVHMREPRRLLRDLGFAGFLTFQLTVGGNVLAALVHPLFLCAMAVSLLRGTPLWRSDDMGLAAVTVLYGTTVSAGYLVSAFLGWLGLARRGLQAGGWVLLLMPMHWLLLSAAAWRAVYQTVTAPYAWEKTEHGLARTSRLAVRMTRSLLALEGYVRGLIQSGQLPSLDDGGRKRGFKNADAPSESGGASSSDRP